MAKKNTANTADWPSLLEAKLREGDVLMPGARGSSLSKCLADSYFLLDRPLLLVAPDPEAASDIHNDICFYAALSGDRNQAPQPFLWPAWDILPSETDNPDVETASDQVAILRACLSGSTLPWIVCSVSSLLQPTLPPKVLKAGGLRVSAGMEISPEALVAHLVEGGLEPVAQIDAPGQFSRRGGIVDVFPLLGDVPYRLDYFGDEIESIRTLDPASQQSGAPLTAGVTLVDVSKDSFRQASEAGERHSLMEYLPDNTLLVLRHPDRIARVADLYVSGFSGEDSVLYTLPETLPKLSRYQTIVVPDLDTDEWPDTPWKQPDNQQTLNLGTTGWERLSGGFDTSIKELALLAERKTSLTIACNNRAEEKRLRQVLEEKSPQLVPSLKLVIGKLSRGFISETLAAEAYVSDHELFGRQTPVRASRKRYAGTPITDFAELREGDYVVHVANGIAKFEGIKTIDKDGAEQDYLALRFAEDARIYVPLSHIDLVQRYIGLGDSRPQLSKLGSAAWLKRKAAVEKAVRDIAQDLLDTQAKRLSSPGIALPQDDGLVREFDASFPYDETPDQLTALEDIRHDQQSPSPMDRLLCGDVGFGKTELAVRAAFRVVNAGRQAAILAPTTILAEQHYRTFSERTADYPVTVECLSRFRSPQEQKNIVENVREGRTDIIVGTHRLLSQDVHFKNLGLVVIDEEQKFGVESKERLKRFRADVDILTMTATPIPRTLHMSLLGLRDISNLTTPPRERHSVKTMVVRYAEDVIRRAILRELSRGGQCFFLHNRVHNIDEIAGRLQQLVPEARFAVGHGQMGEGELLEVMTRFLDGKLDVLVCTTIIESGVDIPKVNTLFVNDADHFGLSELHQLRGRVGRYRHQAYAYFMVPPKRPISPEAKKRLQALQEYSELGSGFRIAMRDLEIRGAGNLLGVEQSGHIHMIGFDLYCRLLEKAVSAEKGEKLEDEVEIELDLGTRAFIPTEYIPSEAQRIDFYRRLTRIRDHDSLSATRDYVKDRYGPPPPPVERCFADQEIRIRMLAVGITGIDRMDEALAVTFTDKAVKRGVMLTRHAGLKTTPLRKNQWRIEVPGIDKSYEPGIYAAGMADKVLMILEDGAGKQPVTRKSGRRKVVPQEETPAAESSRAAATPPPEKEAETEDAAMAFFTSEMLDKMLEEEKQAKARSRKQAAEELAPTPRPDFKKPGSKGKSGSKARAAKAVLKKPDAAIPGGARKVPDMPSLSSRPGIISLGGNKPSAAEPEPPQPKPPVKRARAKPAAQPPGIEAALETGLDKKVLGVELHSAKKQIGVVVSEKAFGAPPFGPMTFTVGDEGTERFYLRCVGMNPASKGKSALVLQAADADEASRAVESFLAAGEATVRQGVGE